MAHLCDGRPSNGWRTFMDLENSYTLAKAYSQHILPAAIQAIPSHQDFNTEVEGRYASWEGLLAKDLEARVIWRTKARGSLSPDEFALRLVDSYKSDREVFAELVRILEPVLQNPNKEVNSCTALPELDKFLATFGINRKAYDFFDNQN